jgi:hypothetical protein
MLEAVQLPARISNLDTGLANVDRNALPHCERTGRDLLKLRKIDKNRRFIYEMLEGGIHRIDRRGEVDLRGGRLQRRHQEVPGELAQCRAELKLISILNSSSGPSRRAGTLNPGPGQLSVHSPLK